MIYVTLGTMFLDFERLVLKMNAIAEQTGEEVVIQLGMSKQQPEHCRTFDFKPHDEVMALQREARVIVAHAGIGATLDALEARRPFIITPRLKRFGEHMNDHQVEIAEAVQRRGWGRMVCDMAEMEEAMANPPQVPHAYQPAKEPLIGAVRAMVERVAQAKTTRVRP
jgi:UDP-N-acetylglucosamine transferase subunit ALG13